MFTSEEVKSFILEDFKQFYAEVVKMKSWAINNTLPLAIRKKYEGEEDEKALILAISQRLVSYLENQALMTSRQGGDFASAYYEEAQYVMAALADEVFLNTNWSGKDSWDDYLVESKLFSSHVAGDQFFDKLDEFLDLRDPANVDIATVYYFSLALGFQGKYRGLDAKKTLDDYKQRLFLFITRRRPQLFAGKRRLFPEAYSHTLDESIPKKLPNPRFWMILLGMLVMVLTVASYVIWRVAISGLFAIADKIISAAGKV
ncbi:MAG: DotU family type IV/VI secretion system protein [Alphaproteobacteria bacterium]|jgi:type VI secretion system protein ImpK|nr:DotU family type IV/VI secretion system protein [Alphaproteobacteria bacterium]MBT5390079.1 DotU family type IV/VI secretion system protein [Alphaproteobacteria bacterium]MBT5540538.1 DotU family type IV/VI secretion system protein [Alphaproteobacteria bacterium]